MQSESVYAVLVTGTIARKTPKKRLQLDNRRFVGIDPPGHHSWTSLMETPLSRCLLSRGSGDTILRSGHGARAETILR